MSPLQWIQVIAALASALLLTWRARSAHPVSAA